MKLKRALILAVSMLAVGAMAAGVRLALRSPMFTVQVVEIEAEGEGPGNGKVPLDSDTITRIAAVPIGRVNLLDLRLQPVEDRILSQEWVREVRLNKRFPQTLSISVQFREPRALIQTRRGHLAYVDRNGHVFGTADLTLGHDLPVLSGFPIGEAGSQRQIFDALGVIEAWSKAPVNQLAQLAAISRDSERGLRAIAVYSLPGGARARAFVDLGHEPAAELDTQLGRLNQIFRHLVAKGLTARQIWANTGKKVVVRLSPGS